MRSEPGVLIGPIVPARSGGHRVHDAASDRSPTLCAVRSSTGFNRFGSDRPSRSSRYTTTVSPFSTVAATRLTAADRRASPSRHRSTRTRRRRHVARQPAPPRSARSSTPAHPPRVRSLAMSFTHGTHKTADLFRTPTPQVTAAPVRLPENRSFPRQRFRSHRAHVIV